jgi:hypothetical protein
MALRNLYVQLIRVITMGPNRRDIHKFVDGDLNEGKVMAIDPIGRK